MNTKPVIRSIHTQEQLNINLRVTLPDFMTRKNKCEIQNPS